MFQWPHGPTSAPLSMNYMKDLGGTWGPIPLLNSRGQAEPEGGRFTGCFTGQIDDHRTFPSPCPIRFKVCCDCVRASPFSHVTCAPWTSHHLFGFLPPSPWTSTAVPALLTISPWAVPL